LKYILFMATLVFFSCNKGDEQSTNYKGHGLESVSKEVLEKYKAKPLSSELTREIEKGNELRTPSLGQMTLDGKTLFVNWNVTGVNQVWKVSGPDSFPVQMTGGDDATSLKDITHDDRFLIVTRDSGGDEYPRIYLQSVAGGELIEVYGAKKVKVSYLTQSKNGKKLYFYANDLGPTTFAIYEYDIELKTKELLTKGSGFWWIQDIDEESDEMILGHAISNTAREYFLFNKKTKVRSDLLGQNEKVSYDINYGTKKNEYFVLTNKFSDFKRLYLYNSVSKKYKPITVELGYAIRSFSIDEEKKRILYSINNKGYIRVRAIDSHTYKEIKLPFKDNDKALLHAYSGNTTSNARYTIFGLSFYNKLRSSYVYDWKKKTLTRWTKSAAPEIDTSKYIPWTLESYEAEDGTKIPMFVKRPDHCKKKTCPVIVSFHGGPEAQSLPYFSAGIEMYTQKGFVYVMPNVRGSSGYGKKWLHSDNGPKRLKVITDIRDIARFIRKNWQYGDTKVKIGVMGGSYGGYSSFIAMTMFAGEYDAGVPIVGMSSLVTFLKNTADYRRYVRESEYGSLKDDMDALIKLSPMTYIDKVKAPMLIIQGARDPRVPAGEAILFKEELDKRGIEGDLIIFSDEGHGVRKRKNRTLYKGHTLKFFMKHLM
jgi:dipeptidyl aminopeptidase/acylaminoacyl peptidase